MIFFDPVTKAQPLRPGLGFGFRGLVLGCPILESEPAATGARKLGFQIHGPEGSMYPNSIYFGLKVPI